MKKLLSSIGILMLVTTLSAQETSITPEQKSIVFVNQGLDKANSSDWTGAVNDYNNAIAAYPRSTTAYYNRATARYNLKDYRGAMMDYNKTIQLDVNDNTVCTSGSYYGRGMCWYALGLKDKACLDFSKAAELGYSEANNAIQNFCN